MSERIYDIDYNKLTGWLTPEPLRQNRLLRFLSLLVSPVVFIYQQFLMYRKAKIYQLMITPQKCYLERLLNDRYDFTQRRIYIEDGIDYPPTYIYQDAELKPIYLGTTAIYTSGESGDLQDDFVIYVPYDIGLESAEMISLVRAYKLAGTKFKIQRF
jgi:hypothetical protein